MKADKQRSTRPTVRADQVVNRTWGKMGCVKCHQQWDPRVSEEGYPVWDHQCVAELAERVRKLEQRIELVATNNQSQDEPLKSAQSDPKRKANT